MSALVEIIRAYCHSLPTLSDVEATQLLRGVNGRGDFGPKLRDWLHGSREVFPETVRVEYPESPMDKGIDVYLEGIQSQTVIGFQIKSANDVSNDEEKFLQQLKAQFLEALLAYGGLKIYVVVFACPPTRFFRIQRTVTDFLQYRQQLSGGMPEIIVLTPGQAAALLQNFSKPLKATDRELLLRDRNWNRFFPDAGARDRANEFREKWPTLTPDERFLPPNNIDEIETSVRNNPLTILSGPPLVGKTYITTQLLWRHYKSGKPVRWIEPMGVGIADNVIPAPGKTFGFSERTRRLAGTLGFYAPQEPRDHYEFVTKVIEPNTLVLIEDPFGMTDNDYEDSLRKYDFFNLNACIEAIVSGGQRSSCRLLITSRQMLFERWFNENKMRIEKPETFKSIQIIHLSSANYGRSLINNYSPLILHAEKLLLSRGHENHLELARLIGKGAKTPQEIQYVVQELPTNATTDDAKVALSRTQPGAVERVEYYCQAENDSERLFLFLLASNMQKGGRSDFARTYSQFHSSMQLSGDAAQSDMNARIKYWPLFYQVVHDREPNNFFVWGVHLKASHPSVIEAAHTQIVAKGEGFVNRLAKIIDSSFISKHSKGERKAVAYYLLNEDKYLNEATLRLIADALPTIIEYSHVLQWHSLSRLIMEKWLKLPDYFRAAFYEVIRDGSPVLTAEVCESFGAFELPERDLWRFYALLSEKQDQMDVGLFSSPWAYFLNHQDEAPAELIAYFDDLAINRPDYLAYILGKHASANWDCMRPTWKSAVSNIQSLSNEYKSKTEGLKQIFFGLFLRRNTVCPEPLLDQLYICLEHPEADTRALAGTATLSAWENLPQKFHERLRQLFHEETDPSVLCDILQEGMSSKGNAHDLELAALTIGRANDVLAAVILEILRSKNENDERPQLEELMWQCFHKGGDYSRAVMFRDIDETTVKSESDIVKLAYIHSQTNRLDGHRPLDKMSCEEFIDLIQSLGKEVSFWAYYVLAHQEDKHPERLQKFLVDSELRGREIKEAIELGRLMDAETRGDDTRRVPVFPIFQFGPLLNKDLR